MHSRITRSENGVGIASAALKKGRLDDRGYRAMVESTTKLNTPGTKLGALVQQIAPQQIASPRGEPSTGCITAASLKKYTLYMIALSPLNAALGTLTGRRLGAQHSDVQLPGGVITAACPNTGSLMGCCDPGSRVWLSESDNPARKYRHTWELVEVGRTGKLLQVPVGKGLLGRVVNALGQPLGGRRELGGVAAVDCVDCALAVPDASRVTASAATDTAESRAASLASSRNITLTSGSVAIARAMQSRCC